MRIQRLGMLSHFGGQVCVCGGGNKNTEKEAGCTGWAILSVLCCRIPPVLSTLQFVLPCALGISPRSALCNLGLGAVQPILLGS